MNKRLFSLFRCVYRHDSESIRNFVALELMMRDEIFTI